MKILFILVIILGFTLMFMWFLLSESTRINEDIKSESWELTQEKTQLDQLIRSQTAEIRGLKESKEKVETFLDNSCGSETGEIRYLKNLNQTCIRGLEQCILEISKIIK